jgi:hypothetical protein
MRVRTVLLVPLPVLAAAAAATLLVPPALAQVPSAPLSAQSTLTLGEGGQFASVTLSAGWTRIGTGPFLPADRATLVSPDGVYRVEVELVPGATAEAEESGDGDVPGAAGTEVGDRLDDAPWSTESLLAGGRVRYAGYPEGGNAVTVAVVDPPADIATASAGNGAPPAAARLVLIATAPAGDAPRYRTVTADLVSSAVFSAEPPGRPTAEARG